MSSTHRGSARPLPGLEDFAPSPLRRQYMDMKRRHPDALLFFRLGDFYETFDDDAEVMARELDIALTGREVGRGERVPMAGIPVQAAEGYIARLIARGYRVALCEQVGEVPTRGLVDRQVVRVLTPGTLVEDALLQAQVNNYLAAVVGEPGRVGLAYVDISTGEFAAAEIEGEGWKGLLQAELARLGPSEIVVARDSALSAALLNDTSVTERPVEWSDRRRSVRTLLERVGAPSLESMGLSDQHAAAWAAGMVINYIAETQAAALRSLDAPRLYAVEGTMLLDAQSRRGLELVANQRTGGRDGSLLGVLDRTSTPMGARLLRQWVSQPLVRLEPLLERQERVAELTRGQLERGELVELLRQMPDLERLANRAIQRLLNPRECQSVGRALSLVGPLRERILSSSWRHLSVEAELLDDCADAERAIEQTLADPPANTFGEGVIREGVSTELDELRQLGGSVQQWLAQLERTERERTGVRALKVGYNRVFGYFLEVSSATLGQPVDYYQQQQTGAATVGEHLERLGYTRRQTLVSAERFIIQSLKDYEARAERAQFERERLERQLYQELLEQVALAAPRMLCTARTVARLDALVSLAEVAAQQRYCQPELTEGEAISIEGGRHPVVEQMLPPGTFVDNDAELSTDGVQIAILTGPNMAGKSTYLRQVALLVLMAQIGSWIPARSARIGLVDRIFTRIGAQDDLASGRSTFMVEMHEVAAILRGATARSLVILDEVGRGTSTYDGVAIATAVLEYLHAHPRLGCKTLFATHYHELADLERLLPRARAFRVDVLEEGNQVVFLHKVVPGGADRSYGVHVAELAGVPLDVTRRAREILLGLEQGGASVPVARGSEVVGQQQPAPSPSDALYRELAGLDVDRLTPLEALNHLHRLVQMARGPVPPADPL